MRPGLKAREGIITLVIAFARWLASMRPGLKAREGPHPPEGGRPPEAGFNEARA